MGNQGQKIGNFKQGRACTRKELILHSCCKMNINLNIIKHPDKDTLLH